jgi:hypothetical protein
VLAALVLLLCGCGSEAEALEEATPMAEAVSATAAAGTARVVMSGAAPAVRCKGVVDYERHRARLSCHLDGVESELLAADSDLYIRPGAFGRWSKAATGVSGSWFEPTTLLDRLKRGTRSTEHVGDATVRGVPTIRYRLLVVDGERRATVDVWIDREGLLRRARYPDGGTNVIEFFDFGVPVEIEKPRPSEVED